ncbi:TIGR02301 family protein [Salinarimonas ramus]|uniref:TIGR02301 family protein n=1 Tax=Salinarimonas ramus TaxID=690164 RepID=A0A917V393_9HYPH|nr:TIGR02301 family protein [Salinarimonas ramus]GGK30204.1 TIGR02301 family protein [Salinarimonas ramus]
MSRARARAGALLLAAALGLVAPALAQDAPPPVEPTPAPAYEPDLMRLSEVMGALAFLRDLCGDADAPEWPARMQRLIEAEGETRAERLAGAYNRGYRAFALTYRVCTPAAERAIAGYLVEGERLSRSVARRFGG